MSSSGYSGIAGNANPLAELDTDGFPDGGEARPRLAYARDRKLLPGCHRFARRPGMANGPSPCLFVAVAVPEPARRCAHAAGAARHAPRAGESHR